MFCVEPMSSTSSSRQRESLIVQEERSGPEGGAMSPELSEVEVIRNSISRIPHMELEDDIVESNYFNPLFVDIISEKKKS